MKDVSDTESRGRDDEDLAAQIRRDRDEDLEAEDSPDIPAAVTSTGWLYGRMEWVARRSKAEGERDSISVTEQADGTKSVTIAGRSGQVDVNDVEQLVALIAFANDALHAEDVRKIRREHVSLVREAAELLARGVQPAAENVAGEPASEEPQAILEAGERYSRLHELADALESYLPDELTDSARTAADIDRVAKETRRDNPDAARFLDAALAEAAEEQDEERNR
jgi:hypothetical protein